MAQSNTAGITDTTSIPGWERTGDVVTSKLAPPRHQRRAVLIAAAILLWFAADLIARSPRLLVYSPDLHLGMEATSAFARLFGALVLFLAPPEPAKPRLRWIAASFTVLATSSLVYGFIPTLIGRNLAINSAMYVAGITWSLAGLLILIGVGTRHPPEPGSWTLAGIMAAIVLVPGALVALPWRLPRLVTIADLRAEVSRDQAMLGGMTVWHWFVSAIPMAIALLAVWAVARRDAGDPLGGWLLIALVLFAGAQLHDMLWPSAYGPVLTPSDLLELLCAGVVAVAGILELQRFGSERAVLLAREQDYSAQLRQLAMVKSDFTAMVAHELGNPLAAIRRQADLIARGRLDDDLRDQAASAIIAESKLLAQLVRDVQESARIERADFAVALRPFPVEALLADAVAFARSLPGGHPIEVEGTTGRVLGDPERIGQVLRNLISNAAKYTRGGAPIELRARRTAEVVTFEIADRGPGIAECDRARIFGKFERGGDLTAQSQPGLGLGLYVAHRIIVAHGSTLTVAARPDGGAVFRFDLEVVT